MDQTTPPSSNQPPLPIAIPPTKPPWYKRAWFHIVLFLVLPYVQVPLMWLVKAFSLRTRIIVTVMGALWITAVIFSGSRKTGSTPQETEAKHSPNLHANDQQLAKAQERADEETSNMANDDPQKSTRKAYVQLRRMDEKQAREMGRKLPHDVFDGIAADLPESNKAFGKNVTVEQLRQGFDGKIDEYTEDAISNNAIPNDIQEAFRDGFRIGSEEVRSRVPYTGPNSPGPSRDSISPKSKSAAAALSSELQHAVRDAVIDYYQHHVPRALLYTKSEGVEDPRIREFLIRRTSQPLRYEIQNSFKRTIDGEVHQFCDVAVESKGNGAAGKIVELLPFDFVKRGNAWYSQLDPERGIQQLQDNSLSDNAPSLLSPGQQQGKEAEARKAANAKANESKLQDYQRIRDRLRDHHLFIQALLDSETGVLVEQFGIRGDRESSGPAEIDVDNLDKFVSILHTYLDWCEKSRAAQLPKFDRLLGEFKNHLSTGRDGYLRNLQFRLRFDPQSPSHCQLLAGSGTIFSPAAAEAAITSIQAELPPLLQEARGAQEQANQEQKRIDDVLSGKTSPQEEKTGQNASSGDSTRGESELPERGTITERIKEVISRWQQFSNGDDPEQEGSLYTDPADYLDEGMLRHEQLVSSLSDDRRKFPYQRYRVTTQPQFQEMDDGSYEVTFQFEFDRLDAARTKRRTGSGTMTWTLVDDQGGLKIKQVRTKVILDKAGDRRSKTDAPPKWLQKLFQNSPGR